MVVQMHQHLGNFPRRLTQHAHAVYEYVACPPVGYPELKEEMWCHRYYLRNLCDDRFSDWPIVDHIPLLQVTCPLPHEPHSHKDIFTGILVYPQN